MYKVEHLAEPELLFANGGRSSDPRIGLYKFGPRTPSDDPNVTMKIGLIGDIFSLSEIQRLFKLMRNKIIPKSPTPQKWKMPFPGLGNKGGLSININTNKSWRQTITNKEIDTINDIRIKSDRIESFISLVEKKIKIIYEKETPPNIIIICIPEKIYQSSVSKNSVKEKMQTEYSDFHSRMKINSILNKIPTQLIHPNTLTGKATQEESDIAWNLIVGLLYKSQKGHPWKLTELEENTCYAGISFYIERGSKLIKAAMAQVFLDTGESFILRADEIDEIQGKMQNHLSFEDSQYVVKKILNQYKDIRSSFPKRLVIHKSSNFWDVERDGIIEGANGVSDIDLITIRDDHPLRHFTTGDYPVLRGTLVTPPDRSEYYLYTNGYIPTLGTYPGHRVPTPIVVKPDRKLCSTPIQDICQEILSFTKLDWNSSHFCKKIPVTLEISRSVGRILAETKAQGIKEIDPHYYYYM